MKATQTMNFGLHSFLKSHNSEGCGPLTTSLIDTPLFKGTFVHRHGQKAFPGFREGGRPLGIAPLPEREVDRLDTQAAHADVNRLLKAEAAPLRRRKRERAAEFQKSLHERHKYGVEEAERRLTSRRLLSALGDWVSFAHSCPALAKITKATGVCRAASCDGDDNKRSLRQLADGWHTRHLGIKAARPVANVRGITSTQCLQQGCCICRSPARFFWASAQRVLKENVNQEAMVNAEVLLLWVGAETEVSLASAVDLPVCTTRGTFVPLHYVRPWRPTFMEVCPPLDVLPALRRAAQIEGGMENAEGELVFFTFSLPQPQNNNYPFLTPYAFAQTVDLQLFWYVCVFRLSQRSVPCLFNRGAHAQVRARVDTQLLLVWSPQDGERRLQEPNNREDNVGEFGVQ